MPARRGRERERQGKNSIDSWRAPRFCSCVPKQSKNLSLCDCDSRLNRPIQFYLCVSDAIVAVVDVCYEFSQVFDSAPIKMKFRIVQRKGRTVHMQGVAVVTANRLI